MRPLVIQRSELPFFATADAAPRAQRYQARIDRTIRADSRSTVADRSIDLGPSAPTKVEPGQGPVGSTGPIVTTRGALVGAFKIYRPALAH